MTAPLRVALLGCGTVGSAVLRLLEEQAPDLAARIGRPVEVAGVAVRRPDRHPDVPPHLLTTDAHWLVTRPDVDLVVEVIGGIEPVRSLLLAAFGAGKSVVSANKALLADDGVELHAAAAEAGVDLYYEASVAGAIPLLRPLRESLAGDQLRRVVGIVNGTTNYILSRMAETGHGFTEALAEATDLGYAEADPTADVDGFDAAAKAAILASLAFHTPVSAADVYREGISAVTSTDVARAAEIGCTVKLLAICERVPGEGGDSVAVRVHPAMIPTTHPLASVGGAFNAVFVEAEAAGQLMFYGQGAGGDATASAVLGDLVAVARNRVAGVAGPGVTAYAGLPARPIAETPTRYHISLDVADKPGVLATVAQEFARHGVSIATVRQDGHGDAATLVIVTHSAPDAALSATVTALRGMPAVRGVTSILRVEGLS
ncbi:homoserine dehydrogenase [Geodermatophilus obscurus]|uniref:Homoserine dehydrogenase n=1 Tax=Geodermatophilus obscurus (strain ATCC 25078 / DSM 43160 / JCM 3152 / CCUG 61914 / KCC A-0152 / KCTC 9177 / NBRC 13315 / NRRL B-3577 / G-20) TaxID=526225 RepID=D2SET0_GEOOG|nr:homoserine dehydrogenase [Geodermatophilus obscurus]ADB76716.1 Homoserine dehydrogenase [Geodermatophilus obscurus DSM 43160]